ncbi:MAG TPA: hypothetical protein VJC12_01330 [Candidatus Paceibacterota bacterium]
MNFNSAKISEIREENIRRKEKFKRKYLPYLKVWYFLVAILILLAFLANIDFLKDLAEQTPFTAFSLFFIFPVVIYFFGYNRPWREGGENLMKIIANENHGTYDPKIFFNFENENAAMFKQGHSRTAKNKITFTKNSGETIRLFFYSFEKNYGKNKRTYNYLIYSISFASNFPHLYLNYKNNKYELNIGEKLSLPTEFEKKFTLSIPRGYHIEALQVFTPDVLEEILRLSIVSDIEIVGNEIIFFLEGLWSVNDIFRGLDILEKEFNSIEKVVNLLKPKLEKVRWQQIGDRSAIMA